MKVIRALSAALVLLAAVVGVPPLLVVIGRLPDPRRWSGQGWIDILLSPDDGSLLLGLLTVAAWLVWLLFTVSVIVELINLRRAHPIRVPGLSGLQGIAAALVIAALTTLGTPRVSNDLGAVTYGEVAPPAVSVSAPQAISVADGPRQAKESSILAVHTVAAGDSLWDIAEQYYGDGGQWRQIAMANPILQRHGPDALDIGWELVVPRQGAQIGPHLVVREGDTLGSLAREHLGAARRWPELYQVNRAVLADPDVLVVGTVLQLPADTALDRGHTPDEDTPDEDTPNRDTPNEDTPNEDTPNEDTPERDEWETEPPPPPVEPAPVPGGGLGSGPAAVEVMSSDADPTLVAVGLSGMAAAAVIGALSLRRALQLHQRPVGRRISHPGPEGAALEQALGSRQTPGPLAAVDRGMRLIAAHCRDGGHPVPPMGHIVVSDQRCEFHLRQEVDTVPPAPFRADGPVWVIDDVSGWLATGDSCPEAPHLWPATVGIGTRDHAQVLVNLESWGAVGVGGSDSEDVLALVGALACDLALHPWTSGARLTVLGRADAVPWLAGLDLPELRVSQDPDQTLARLDAAATRRTPPSRDVAELRLDPTLAEAWSPEIVVVTTELTETQLARLQAATRGAGVVAVLSNPAGPTPLTVTVDGAGGAAVSPVDWTIQHHRVGGRAAHQLGDLLDGTAGPTGPAFWWAESGAPRRVRAPDEDTPTASILGMAPARGVLVADRPPGGSVPAPGPDDPPESPKEVAPVTDSPHDPTGPRVLLLGPIDLVGARGVPPPRARLQCIEYATWLLEHPGSTAITMTRSLLVAEGTRRSNMSRLRSWLGQGDDGPYLPDAYSGRINLTDAVSSDWDRAQVLVEQGVNLVADDALVSVLELVRGAPLADAAPGQWHWAEELRTDMISLIRDVGVELADRCRAAGELEQARWAIDRTLLAAPEDELLLGALIRVEHGAGDRAAVGRIAGQIVRRARDLGVDLHPETVALLQVVLEGRVRSRRDQRPHQQPSH